MCSGHEALATFGAMVAPPPTCTFTNLDRAVTSMVALRTTSIDICADSGHCPALFRNSPTSTNFPVVGSTVLQNVHPFVAGYPEPFICPLK